MSTSGASLIETFIELMELPGPTGQEERVLKWCRETWAALGTEVTATPIGNVVAHLPGPGPRLLVQGHADEIGFVVKSIDKRGFVWLDNAQTGSRTFHDRYPIGQPALIVGRAARVPGVFATITGHILSTKSSRDPSSLDTSQFFVDVGVDSNEEALALGIHVGAGVLWNPPTRRLGRRIVGKAIDDRVALAVMTQLLRELDRARLRYDLTIAATVQEEIGLVGALSLGDARAFDLAIAIDNGPIGDYPLVDPREMPVRLGDGPTLVYKDGWVHYDRRVIDRLIEVAVDRAIPIQQSTFQGFGSDGAALIRAGIPTALLGVATRYTHSAFEMADERDVQGTLDLLHAFVTADARPLPLGPS